MQVVQKKMVYLYLSCYGKSNPDLALLTLNTLRKDLDSHNAMIRGLALRTLSSLRLPTLRYIHCMLWFCFVVVVVVVLGVLTFMHAMSSVLRRW